MKKQYSSSKLLKYLSYNFFLLFSLFLPYSSFAECSLSEMLPKIEPNDSKITIEWRVQWACWEEINEFKVYYFKDWNWQSITTVLAGQNQAKYTYDWDVTDMTDWNYKIRILQSWDSISSVTSDNFVIDRTAPVIRDDVWILPSWWEILKWKIIIKWNKESIFDSLELASKPITISYSLDWVKWSEPSWGWNIENSWLHLWESTWVNWQNVILKIVVKDSFWNSTSKILEKSFVIDNTAPKKPEILKVNDIDADSVNYITYTPNIKIWGVDTSERNLKIQVYDTLSQRSYWVMPSLNSEELIIQLEPINDWSYALVAVAIDEAWNRSEESDVVNFIRDSYPPVAPKIKFAAISNNNLKVSVDWIEEWDVNWELLLMNWDKLLRSQGAKDYIFNINMIPQGVYKLYVIHKDLAWNSSNESAVKKIIFDTNPPQDVSLSIPTWVALYEDVKIKVSAIDNVWIEKYLLNIDDQTIWESSDWDYILKTENISNWNHIIKAVAYDFSWQAWMSRNIDIKVFNPMIKSHWANNFIRTLFNDWVISWNANTWIVDPEWLLNRASALKLVMKYFWIEPVDSFENSSYFKDVSLNLWYWPYVEWAYQKWLISWVKPKYKVHSISNKPENTNDFLNVQYILKGLWYNIEATWNADKSTIRAIANYQQINWLTPSWSIWNNTIRLLNNEEIVKNEKTITDNFVYFKPWDLIDRAQVLKIIIDTSWVKLNDVWWVWYSKYVKYAKEKWIMTWNKSWDLMLDKPVTIWEISKMVLKVEDLTQ